MGIGARLAGLEAAGSFPGPSRTRRRPRPSPSAMAVAPLGERSEGGEPAAERGVGCERNRPADMEVREWGVRGTPVQTRRGVGCERNPRADMEGSGV